jgi:SAM-dependent methyltransferase
MDKSLLVKIFGFPATLIHGDTLITDRWRWLKKRLPETNNGECLIDVGCGGGAFSIGAALRGYNPLGLTWNARDQNIAKERAKICGANAAKFDVLDVRDLDSRNDLVGKFDVAICLENMEHIINDKKLIINITACLKPGGRLLLTTPNLLYRPISPGDKGPFTQVEDGGHVRRGYTKAMLEELCIHANLIPENISYCSGFLSQKITATQRVLSDIHPLLAWTVILPLRILPPIFDLFIAKFLHWPYYSICLEAIKPRYQSNLISLAFGNK